MAVTARTRLPLAVAAAGLTALSFAAPAAAAPDHEYATQDVWGCVLGGSTSQPAVMAFVLDAYTAKGLDPEGVRVTVAPSQGAATETEIPHEFEGFVGTVKTADVRAAAGHAERPELRVHLDGKLEATMPLDPSTGRNPSSWTPEEQHGCEQTLADGSPAPLTSFGPVRAGEEAVAWSGQHGVPGGGLQPEGDGSALTSTEGPAHGTIHQEDLPMEDGPDIQDVYMYTSGSGAHGLDHVAFTYTTADGGMHRFIHVFDILTDAEWDAVVAGGTPAPAPSEPSTTAEPTAPAADDADHSVPDRVETGDATAWWLAVPAALALGVLVRGRRAFGLA